MYQVRFTTNKGNDMKLTKTLLKLDKRVENLSRCLNRNKNRLKLLLSKDSDNLSFEQQKKDLEMTSRLESKNILVSSKFRKLSIVRDSILSVTKY